MKKLTSLFASCVWFAFLTEAAIAGTVSGFVFCDANQNQIIDPDDVPLSGVQVRIKGLIGNFANATETAADGSFSLQIPAFDPLALRRSPLSQTYVETLNASTLPPGSTIISPLPIVTQGPANAYYIDYLADLVNVGFNSGAGFSTTGDWLINNPGCQDQNPNPNPNPDENPVDCRLSGNGVMKGSRSGNGKHMFGGRITQNRRQWTHVAKGLNLQFKSTTIATVECGTNGMTFTGTGILKKTKGKNRNPVTVSFTVFVEDRGGKKRDRYYFRAFDGDATLLLVSADQANPVNIAPISISSGNLTIRSP